MCQEIHFDYGRIITGIWKETGKPCFQTDVDAEGYDGSKVKCLCDHDLGQIIALIGEVLDSQWSEVESINIDFNYFLGVRVKVTECEMLEWWLEDEDTEESENYGPYFRDRDGGLWTHTSGQEGDVCIGCERDLSDVDDFFMNNDCAQTRYLCGKCAGFGGYG